MVKMEKKNMMMKILDWMVMTMVVMKMKILMEMVLQNGMNSNNRITARNLMAMKKKFVLMLKMSTATTLMT